MKPKNEAAVHLGRLGGLAGKGKRARISWAANKCRYDPEFRKTWASATEEEKQALYESR